MFINSTAPLSRVEEYAGALIDRILTVAKDTSIARDQFREALFCLLIGESKTCGQPLDIPPGNQDVVIRPAIAWTFRAVVEDRELSIYHMICSRILITIHMQTTVESLVKCQNLRESV